MPSLAVGILGLTINTITKHVSHTRRDRLHITHQGESGHQKIKERMWGGAEESRLPRAAPMHKQGQSAFARSSPPAGDEAGTKKEEVGVTAVEILIMHN